MATTTTNYGFDIPQSTDLVKDGATAIATLGQDIDTAMNTALGTKKAGMVLLNTTSFSGVASQSINDVFSSTYTNYRLLITHSQGNNQYLGVRLRVGGADASGSNYTRQQVRGIGASASAAESVNGTFNVLGSGDSTFGALTCDIFRPFETERTKFINTSFIIQNITIMGCDHSLSTSYTGFTIFPELGNMTGTVSVYGYNK